jgi:serine/threonine protein phosphatase PrpC
MQLQTHSMLGIQFLLITSICRVFVLPHIQKRAKGGEDAAVVTERLLAVADGVGGWAESGVDPAIYARGLCKK